MDKPKVDNLERAQLVVINRKHQFIMQLAGQMGRTATEIEEILKLIDYQKEIEWALMCYDNCDMMAHLQAEAAAAAQNAQTGSGS